MFLKRLFELSRVTHPMLIVWCGKNTSLNQYRGEPELEDAFEWTCKNISQEKYKGIILNNDSWFKIDTGTSSKEYSPVDKKDKKKYIERNPSIAKILDVNTKKGSDVIAKIAGILSKANKISVNSIIINAIKRGVAAVI